MTPLLSSAILRTQSDARLIALARDGHERAFEVIVERYRKPLHSYCRRMLSETRSEDAVQQAFLNAWSSLNNGCEVRDLRAWLYRIVHNAAVNVVERSTYDYDELRESLLGADAPDADFERRVIIRQTLSAVASLPERQREALLRIAVEGRSQQEVAKDLGVSELAVRQLVHRARSALRAAATAVTPVPLVNWAVSVGVTGAPTAQRIAELAASAGSAGVASILVKGSAAVVVAGAIATGGAPALIDDGNDEDRSGGSPAIAAAGPQAGALTAPQLDGDAATFRVPDDGRSAVGDESTHDAASPEGTTDDAAPGTPGSDGAGPPGAPGSEPAHGHSDTPGIGLVSVGGDDAADVRADAEAEDDSAGGDSLADVTPGGRDDPPNREESRPGASVTVVDVTIYSDPGPSTSSDSSGGDDSGRDGGAPPPGGGRPGTGHNGMPNAPFTQGPGTSNGGSSGSGFGSSGPSVFSDSSGSSGTGFGTSAGHGDRGF